MARSVGTNASYIRKVLGLLKKAAIVSSHRGITGFSLSVPPEQLTLLRVYQAVMEEEQCHLLDIHQNANDQCVVGRHSPNKKGACFVSKTLDEGRYKAGIL